MKKMILSASIILLSIGAFAQTSNSAPQEMKELRHDIREKKDDKRQRKHARIDGNKEKVKSETREIKADNSRIKYDAEDAKEAGVKHPIRKAHGQIHRQNQR